MRWLADARMVERPRDDQRQARFGAEGACERFAGRLARAVVVDRFDRSAFTYGLIRGRNVTVYLRGADKKKPGHRRNERGRPQEIQRSGDVDTVNVLNVPCGNERDGGEMDDRVEADMSDAALHRRVIGDIHPIMAGIVLRANGIATVHLVPALEKCFLEVPPDEAADSGYEDFHG